MKTLKSRGLAKVSSPPELLPDRERLLSTPMAIVLDIKINHNPHSRKLLYGLLARYSVGMFSCTAALMLPSVESQRTLRACLRLSL